MILDRADTAIPEYNRACVHNNLSADAIYCARETMDPFSAEYEPHIIELASFHDWITDAYGCLAASGEGALHGDQAKQFNVGATKILHWIAPALFIMLDRKVA